jgi:ATP-dependent protease ClpP protease subunit
MRLAQVAALAAALLTGAAPASDVRAADEPKTVVVRFFADVTVDSVQELLSVVDAELAAGTKRFIVLIASVGGSVHHGFAAYNYLRGIPAEVITHNFSSADSIAVVLYCAGSIRRAAPEARFFLHGPSMTLREPSYDAKKLQERIGQIRSDTSNMASVIARSTRRSLEEVEKALIAGTALSADEAKKWGLVQEITTELYPPGARVISIRPKAAAELEMALPGTTDTVAARSSFEHL